MNKIILGIILVWSIFWLGYAIFIYNSEKFYYKYKKVCTRQDKPILFHLEIIISVIWSMTGYTMLYFFLLNNIK